MEIKKLTKDKFTEAVDLIFNLGLDTREEIEHHLEDLDTNLVALEGDEVIGVIGWYQDNVNYANEAMGRFFPGEEVYWVGFFGVKQGYQKQGTGTALLKALEQEVQKLGENELWVSSVPEAKSYYEKMGFQLVTEGTISGSKHYFLKKTF
jgi:GNAT superfamily N-acetyltransferase